MSYDRLLREIESLKRKVERLSAMDAPTPFNPAVLDDYLLEADAALLYLGKNAKANDSDKLDGLDSTAFLGVNDTAYNSARLGNVLASQYALKSDIPPAPVTLGLKRRTLQSITSATWEAIYWSNVTEYNNGFSFSGGQGITIPSNGIYNISAYIGITGSTTTLTTIGIFVNDETKPRAQNNAAVNSSGTHCNIAMGLLLATNDVVYLKVYHNNGTSLATLGAPQLPTLHIERISSGT